MLHIFKRFALLFLISIFWLGCTKSSNIGANNPGSDQSQQEENNEQDDEETVANPEPPEEPADLEPNEPNPGDDNSGEPEPPKFKFNAMWENSNVETQIWTELTSEAIEEHGEDLLGSEPSDIENFCPNFDNLDNTLKKQFWIYFISTIAKFESNFNPTLFFIEDFNDSNGNPIVSRGLLQISVESGRGYRCLIPQEKDLHIPATNLECGVRILNRWLGRDKVISGTVTSTNGKKSWRGGARYWYVLRSKDRLKKIQDLNKKQSYCQLAN